MYFNFNFDASRPRHSHNNPFDNDIELLSSSDFWHFLPNPNQLYNDD